MRAYASSRAAMLIVTLARGHADESSFGAAGPAGLIYTVIRPHWMSHTRTLCHLTSTLLGPAAYQPTVSSADETWSLESVKMEVWMKLRHSDT